MPLLFYAQFPEPLPDQALFGEQAHEGPNCFVLAKACGRIVRTSGVWRPAGERHRANGTKHESGLD